MTKSGSNLFQQNPMIYFLPSNFFSFLKKVEKTAADKLITVSEPQKKSIKSITVNICKRTLYKIRYFFKAKSQF